MSTRKAANKSNKYILDECFKPLEEFPLGKLPTLKQVLERCLYFKDYRKDSVQREVSGEVFNLWVNYKHYVITGEPGKYQAPINYKNFKKNFAMQCCSSILFEGNEHLFKKKKINMQRTKVLVGS